jgi:hypothetical protein
MVCPSLEHYFLGQRTSAQTDEHGIPLNGAWCGECIISLRTVGSRTEKEALWSRWRPDGDVDVLRATSSDPVGEVGEGYVGRNWERQYV